MKTLLAKVDKTQPQNWRVVDANGQVLGRLAVRVANLLRGKTKPIYTPHVAAGDFVVVVNAEKVVVTGKKETDKTYMTYSMYPGKEKIQTVADIRRRHPEKLIEHAVRGMMPKNRLGRAMMSKLKIYRGPNHPHAAQKPQPFALK
jgi:large subunit ribosomal protein L13